MSIDLPTLLAFVKKAGGSDLHLSAGAQPMARVQGDMRVLEVQGEDLSDKEKIRRLIYGFLTDSQKKRLENELELDAALSIGDGERFRANVFLQDRGLAAVLRVIPSKIRTLEELGLPNVVREIGYLEKGLVLVTGPTGSGKSTTLAAIVDMINRTRKGHILTIEDPIEFVHKQKKCMINQREIGAHTKGFRNALRSALREDPDVILVGEMRDYETIALALTAAETGHLVFGTLHTSSAAKTVDRVINVFPPSEQQQIREIFATSIQAIIAQILLKKRGGGRVAAHEILLATDAAKAMIRDGKSFQLNSVIQTSGKLGMQMMEASLERLIQQGLVDPEEAQEVIDKITGNWMGEDGPRRPPPRDDEDREARKRERDKERADRDREKKAERDRKDDREKREDLGDTPAKGTLPRYGGESQGPSTLKPRPRPAGEPMVVIGGPKKPPDGATTGGTPALPDNVMAAITQQSQTASAPPPRPGPGGPPQKQPQPGGHGGAPPAPPPPPPAKRPAAGPAGARGDSLSGASPAIDVESLMAKVKEQQRREEGR